MSDPARRRARYEDLYDLPETVVGEIIDGELLMSPRPRARHALAASRMGADLIGAFDRAPGEGGPGGWILLFEPELHLGSFTGAPRPQDETLVPDLAGWRRERMPRVPDVAAFELPPDWVCEVLSPRTERIDRIRKMRVYAASGVAWVWLLAPEHRILEVYRLDGDVYSRVDAFDGEQPVKAEPFDAVALDLTRWWMED